LVLSETACTGLAIGQTRGRALAGPSSLMSSVRSHGPLPGLIAPKFVQSPERPFRAIREGFPAPAGKLSA